jgi:LuxR family maltose regulon positive regulatory protein
VTVPVLTVKLRIPQLRPEFIPRPRLFAHLDAVLSRKLALVSAPADFSKTTLISQWVDSVRIHQTNPPDFAWLALDAGDNDLERFTAYFIAALQTIPGITINGYPIAGDLISRTYLPISFVRKKATDLVSATLNEVDALSNDIVLIMDDYHLITNRKLHSSVAYLLQYIPSRLHLVLSTLADPPLPIASLRGKGQLIELRMANLRFTTDEAINLFQQMLTNNVALDDLLALAGGLKDGLPGSKWRGYHCRCVRPIRGFARTDCWVKTGVKFVPLMAAI